MKSFAPSAPLAPFVRELMIVEVGEQTTRLRLPEPGLVLGIRYRGSASVLTEEAETRLPDASLAGMTRVARLMRTLANGAVILARFHPGGAAQFFDEPLSQLFGTTVALDALLPHAEVDRLRMRVAEARGEGERVAALDRFLLGRLRARGPDEVVRACVGAIRETHGAVRIRELARAMGISQDRLEKRFRRRVGTSPKHFATLTRFQSAIDAWRPGRDLAELAADAGYFDQSHFNREFRAITSSSPGRFFRSHGPLGT